MVTLSAYSTRHAILIRRWLHTLRGRQEESKAFFRLPCPSGEVNQRGRQPSVTKGSWMAQKQGELGSRIRKSSTTILPNYTLHKEILVNRNFYLQLFFLLRGNLWRIKRFKILNQVITQIRGFNASLQNLIAHPTQEVLNCCFS